MEKGPQHSGWRRHHPRQICRFARLQRPSQGVVDSPGRLEIREVKYRTIIHAEISAILTAKQDLEGCTIYLWPFMPYSQCGAAIVEAGIQRVVIPKAENERWAESFKFTTEMFTEGGVELVMVPSATAVS